jgi:hypothetical protein
MEGALEETVRGAAGRIEPRDVGQIQEQLTRAAADGAWRDSLRAAGFARALDFDWRATAEATLGVYAKAAALNPRPGRANDRMDPDPLAASRADMLVGSRNGEWARPSEGRAIKSLQP